MALENPFSSRALDLAPALKAYFDADPSAFESIQREYDWTLRLGSPPYRINGAGNFYPATKTFRMFGHSSDKARNLTKRLLRMNVYEEGQDYIVFSRELLASAHVTLGDVQVEYRIRNEREIFLTDYGLIIQLLESKKLSEAYQLRAYVTTWLWNRRDVEALARGEVAFGAKDSNAQTRQEYNQTRTYVEQTYTAAEIESERLRYEAWKRGK